ncbi:MAG: type 1 glutamine amidotransferase domain-containing protein [Bacteroidota bacterium]
MRTHVAALAASIVFAAADLGGGAVAQAAERKVLIVVTSHNRMGVTDEATGLWLSEMTHPYHELDQAGFTVDIASIQGGAAPVDPRSIGGDDPVNAAFMGKAATRAKLENTLALDKVSPGDYAAILFSGGHGTVWDFPSSPAVDRVASAIAARGGVAAVCHGPSALLNVHAPDGNLLIKGKRVAGFSNAEERAAKLEAVVPFLLEDRLKEGGAQYVEGAMFTRHVVVDGSLVTGQNPQSAAAVGEAIVELLRHRGG